MAVKTKPPAHAPYLPPAWDEAIIASLQALQRGDATKDQQQMALRWIIEVDCATYDMTYRPGGHEGDRDTAFAAGRQFPGQQIVKLLRLNLNQLRKAKHG